MRRQPRWPLLALLPIALGVLWLVAGWRAGIIAGVLACLPGVVFTGAGTSLLIWPGDRHINHWLTLCAAVSVVLAVLLVWSLGLTLTLLLIAGGLFCALLGGFMALWQDAVPEQVPTPRINLALIVKAALDEGMLAFFILCVRVPRGDATARDRESLECLQIRSANEGWADRSAGLHATPDTPQHVRRQTVITHGHTFDWITFDSAYDPPADLPGTAQWQAQQANRSVHARIFSHDDGPRPWLLCIHGYQMGTPGFDFSLFRIKHLHRKLGFNLIMPILPLHGVRRATWVSGGQFLDGALIHLLHAECQSLWDLRRCLAWLRATQEVERLGVLGYSLGGYNAALLAAFDSGLACVIAGIPLTDFPAVLWRHMPTVDRRYMAACGIRREWVNQVMTPISPLHWSPKVPWNRRYIFAGTGDQLVPPEQALALWQHWDKPAMHWYQGTHLSVRREPGVSAFVDRALRDSGLVVADRVAVAG